jgi:DNA gyrase subunit B
MKDNKAILESSYDSDKIQVLEGLESVRKNPGMYIGSTDARGSMKSLIMQLTKHSPDIALL